MIVISYLCPLFRVDIGIKRKKKKKKKKGQSNHLIIFHILKI